MPWTHRHDALYLHLTVACIDGGISAAERQRIGGVVVELCPDRAAQGALLSEVTERLTTADEALIAIYQSCCIRLAERDIEARMSLLASLHRVAIADDRLLRPEEVVLLRMAVALLGLEELASVSRSGRLVRRFIPVEVPA